MPRSEIHRQDRFKFERAFQVRGQDNSEFRSLFRSADRSQARVNLSSLHPQPHRLHVLAQRFGSWDCAVREQPEGVRNVSSGHNCCVSQVSDRSTQKRQTRLRASDIDP